MMIRPIGSHPRRPDVPSEWAVGNIHHLVLCAKTNEVRTQQLKLKCENSETREGTPRMSIWHAHDDESIFRALFNKVPLDILRTGRPRIDIDSPRGASSQTS